MLSKVLKILDWHLLDSENSVNYCSCCCWEGVILAELGLTKRQSLELGFAAGRGPSLA